MKLDKAISVNTRLAKELDIPHRAEERKAVNLGIEALKFRQRWEAQEGEDDFPLLPGETEE